MYCCLVTLLSTLHDYTLLFSILRCVYRVFSPTSRFRNVAPVNNALQIRKGRLAIGVSAS